MPRSLVPRQSPPIASVGVGTDEGPEVIVNTILPMFPPCKQVPFIAGPAGYASAVMNINQFGVGQESMEFSRRSSVSTRCSLPEPCLRPTSSARASPQIESTPDPAPTFTMPELSLPVSMKTVRREFDEMTGLFVSSTASRAPASETTASHGTRQQRSQHLPASRRGALLQEEERSSLTEYLVLVSVCLRALTMCSLSLSK